MPIEFHENIRNFEVNYILPILGVSLVYGAGTDFYVSALPLKAF